MASISDLSASAKKSFRIRTITAGVPMKNIADLKVVEQANQFLQQSKQHYEDLNYVVQTVRIATQPYADYSGDWRSDRSLKQLIELDQLAQEHQLNFSIGYVDPGQVSPRDFASWAAELIKSTQNINFSVQVANAESGVMSHAVRCAAETMHAIAPLLANGDANFRFAATACCPPGTPFFPAAYYQNEPAFSIGLETPNVLREEFANASGLEDAKQRLKSRLEQDLRPVELEALIIAKQSGRSYRGMDVSPAPAPDASIGAAIELLSKAPFGSTATLSACAAITDVLKSLEIQQCGYSGLMLPVLEDKVLAQRAIEKRYSVSKLLLYSSVCGTGLDVVPLAGETSVDELASVIGDMAALANKYQKPLSARLLPLPGKKVGDSVSFDNPYLVDAVVMGID